ncbi:MAG: DUF4437 domain-containing protein [Rhodospirillaceae bacterium]|nr:DUF4437 domain-containing protein [Rhodospirillaceae bacterium]
MARPQTENLNAFAVAPAPWRPPGWPDGATLRELNRDPDTGALSALLHMPAGWAWPGPGSCSADQDLFVFEGALDIGGHRLANGGFCFYPAGVVQNGWHVREAATLYVIYNRAPIFEAGAAHRPGAAVAKSVPARDTWAMDWFDPLAASKPSMTFHPGIFVKELRVDPDTGTRTHLAGLMPGWFQEGIEVHPVREESLVISGDVHIATVDGKPGYTVTVGGFYSRPAGVPHGPLASKNGNVGIVHCEGLLGIDYRTDPEAERRIMAHLRGFPWK